MEVESLRELLEISESMETVIIVGRGSGKIPKVHLEKFIMGQGVVLMCLRGSRNDPVTTNPDHVTCAPCYEAHLQMKLK